MLRFSGSRDQADVESYINTLRAAIDDSVWQATDKPVAWFYDPPWTLWFRRRNEVAIPVERRDGGSRHRP